MKRFLGENRGELTGNVNPPHTLDEFTVGGQPEEREPDRNCLGQLMPNSLPKQGSREQMRALPWTNPLEPPEPSGPLRGSELRFPLN